MMSATRRILRGEVGQSRMTAIAFCFFSAFSFSALIAFLASIFYLFFLVTTVPTECTGGSELAEFVPYHILSNIHRNEFVSVVDSDRLTHEVRRNHTCSRPCFDHRLFVALGLSYDLGFEFRLNVRSFFQ